LGRFASNRNPRQLTPYQLLILAALASLALGGCGGSGPAEPNTPQAEVDSEPSDSAPDEQWDDTTSEEPVQLDPCADGSCSQCGDAVCLSGFYCNESAGACGWLPECVKTPSCTCLERSMPQCSCEERDGGLYVNCD